MDTTIREFLEYNRWNVDRVIMNYHGERVWLKPSLNKDGKRDGITDCCLEEEPCEYHQAFKARLLEEMKEGGGKK